MNVLVTGATGFVGRSLTLRLSREGHRVVAVTRSPERARGRLGAEVDLIALGDEAALSSAVSEADAVVNLAGEPIFPGRWSAKRKRALKGSRVGLTESLVGAMREAARRPATLVSASAVGYYGDGGEEVLGESAPMGSGFAAELCRDWEAAADGAAPLGVRVVKVRIGVVLGAEGGALGSMIPPFRAGLGGRIGSGRQYFPWIHLDDLVEIFATALADERYAGVLNATAPEPVSNAEFTKALGRALGRPTLAPVPAAALRVLFGESAAVLLEGQRAVPRRLQDLGFKHAFDSVDGALADILSDERCVIEPAHQWPEFEYLRKRRPTHILRQTTRIEAPIDEVFDFFSKADNLGAITPEWMGFRIETPRPIEMRPGTQIDYTVRLGPFPMRWRTVIERWEPGVLFADAQYAGPYRAWWHEHHFRAEGARTVMEDRVYYAPPLGSLGTVANRLFVERTLRRIFAYRAKAIRYRFKTDRALRP